MRNSLFHNMVTAALIALFAFAPILSAREAQAQVSVGSYTYGSGGTSGSLDAYIKGLGPAIVQLPGCKKKINSWIKDLFTNTKGVVAPDDSSRNVVDSFDERTGQNLYDIVDVPASIGTDVQVVAPLPNKSEAAKQASIDASLKRIKESTADLNEKETCTDAIGKMIIKMLIQKITLATVQWIQNGFDGGAAFPQGLDKYFEEIGREEILKFGISLNLGADCTAVLEGGVFQGTTGGVTGANSPSDCVSPYAKSWFQSQISAINKRFNDNARYSLNELIAETTPQYTGADFRADFSAGGWNAWSALTAVPANNPIGFGLMAESELAKRLAGTSKARAELAAESLDQASGFLGDQRCADPQGLTREEERAALEEFNNTGDSICRRWEYVTPGKIVAEEALKISHFQSNALLEADTLNDAIAALVDALLQRFSNDLYEQGLVAFSNEGSDGGLILNSYALTGGYSSTSQVEKDFPEYLQGTTWFGTHPSFNIRTDLTQAIIDEQRTYIDKLEQQNQVLPQLILNIKQLDYCIPGPSPKNYNNILKTELFSGPSIFEQTKASKIYDTVTNIGLGAILSFDPTGILSGIASFISKKEEERVNKKMIATHLGLMFDVHIYGAYGYSFNEDDNKVNQDQVLNESDMRALGRNILASYKEVVHNVYFNGSKSLAPMPIVTSEARVEFNRIPGYEGVIADNEEEISLMKSVVQRLAKIKDSIEDLGPVPDPSDPTYDQYEADIATFIPEFGRLTRDMVTGNDVSRVDKVYKEISDKLVYVHDDLLVNGCEAEMIELYQNDPATYSKFYRRQPYGEPIQYLYGDNSGQKTTNILDTIPNKNHAAFDPTVRTTWGEGLLKNWNPNDGFLYGSIFWNFWARPIDGGNHYSVQDGKTPNPPNLVKLQVKLEQDWNCPEFIDVVYFSYPGGNGVLPADIGGLEPEGGGEIIPYGQNICGVITRRLEKLMNIY